MKCPTCKKEIELKNHYQHSPKHRNDKYVSPCDTCANNIGEVDEIPCIFCTHINPDAGILK